VRERPRVVELPPQEQWVRGGDRQRRRELPRAASCDQHERRHKCDCSRPREEREADDDSRLGDPAALGEQERAEAEKEEERLRVDRLEEERRREERQVKHGTPRALSAQALLGESLQEHEGTECGRQRERDPRDDVVPAQGASEPGDQPRVEWIERRVCR
jgi:hypothetical protein